LNELVQTCNVKNYPLLRPLMAYKKLLQMRIALFFREFYILIWRLWLKRMNLLKKITFP